MQTAEKMTFAVEDLSHPRLNDAAQDLIFAVSRIMDGLSGKGSKIRGILAQINDHFDCEVGVLIQKGKNLHCYAAVGLSGGAQKTVTYLCRRLHREHSFSPLGCLCGEILGDHAKAPPGTRRETIWCNSSSEFERRRGWLSGCGRGGVESLARVPLYSEGILVGLLLLNDHSKGRFGLGDIRLLEIVAANIGVLLERELRETDLREKEVRVFTSLHYDPLTALPNRSLLEVYLKESLAGPLQMRQKMALLFIDLDRFKRINDAFGRDICDRVICAVSRRLRDLARDSGLVARWELDEFVIVVNEVAERGEAEDFARKILTELARPLHVEDHDFYLTASIGIALFPDNAQDMKTLLRSASVARYRAKELGRNSYQCHTPEMKVRSDEKTSLEISLRLALHRQEFTLNYQPQIDLATGRLIGMEALLRWSRPNRGIISPDEFIPLAEEAGLILPIGEWVLRTACAQNRQWQENGHPPVRVSVNISARQFQQPDFLPMVRNVLQETGLDPQWLELEITESCIMKNADESIAALEDLKKVGLSLAIDDFGTGYSSLSYLKLFPIDVLKIDRSFIRDVTTNPNDASIVRSIIALATSMSLKTTAEGIETEDQLQFLLAHGCGLGQGYLFGRPIAVGEIRW